MSSPADYKRFKPLFAILWFLVLVAVGRDLSTEGKTLTTTATVLKDPRY
ncbi:MAG: hypothetical protein HGA24_10230 [Candidatus Aminicenantes bacterium]|nr:hypothetical protein [Candidatus Aminicenantes bacterium]